MKTSKMRLRAFHKVFLGGLLILLLAGVTLGPTTAAAHPLGNFTVNHYSRLEIGASGVNLFYVLDMAEIPTLQEKTSLDLNQDGQISDQERLAYLDRKADELKANLQLKLGNTPTPLNLIRKDLSFLTGQGGLQTLRLTMQLQTAALSSNISDLSYRDTNYNDRLGWREVVVRNADGVALQKSSVGSLDQSNELRTYPQDMLASPLNVSEAQVTFRLDPSVRVVQATQAGDVGVRADDPFANLINGQELTVGFILFALGASVVLGAFHAFSPGHGKTVVGAYLVGSRGTARHALFLGGVVTVTHTIGVFVLGLITLFASQFVLPEKLYPWLSLLSGLLVVVMGVLLFRSRLRTARPALVGVDHDHSHSGHDHSHNGHTHSQADHSHDQPHLEPAHEHSPADHSHDHSQAGHIHDEVSVPALAFSASLAQSQSGVLHASVPQIYEPAQANHTHSHDHADHDHQHEASLDHQHEADHDHGAGWHTHGPGSKPHSHLPPGADGSVVTWRKLLLFGISAGLLPCPSALIVMLSAISLNRTAFGLILIVFFSLGLAGTLTGIGLVLVYARDWLARTRLKPNGGLLRILPVVSALAVTVIGVVISYEALIQTGLFGR